MTDPHSEDISPEVAEQIRQHEQFKKERKQFHEKEGLKPQKVAKSYRRKNVPQDPVPSPLPKTNEAEEPMKTEQSTVESPIVNDPAVINAQPAPQHLPQQPPQMMHGRPMPMHPVMPGMHGMPGPFPMMQMPPQFYQMSPAQQMQYQQHLQQQQMHMYHQMMQQQGMMPNRGIMQQNHPSQAARAPTETPKESADKEEEPKQAPVGTAVEEFPTLGGSSKVAVSGKSPKPKGKKGGRKQKGININDLPEDHPINEQQERKQNDRHNQGSGQSRRYTQNQNSPQDQRQQNNQQGLLSRPEGPSSAPQVNFHNGHQGGYNRNNSNQYNNNRQNNNRHQSHHNNRNDYQQLRPSAPTPESNAITISNLLQNMPSGIVDIPTQTQSGVFSAAALEASLLPHIKEPLSAINQPMYSYEKRNFYPLQNPDGTFVHEQLMTPLELSNLVNSTRRNLDGKDPYIFDFYFTTFVENLRPEDEIIPKDRILDLKGYKKQLKCNNIDENGQYNFGWLKSSLGHLSTFDASKPKPNIDVSVIASVESTFMNRYALKARFEKCLSILNRIEDLDRTRVLKSGDHILENSEETIQQQQKHEIDLLVSELAIVPTTQCIPSEVNVEDIYVLGIVSSRKGISLLLRALPLLEINISQAIILTLLRRPTHFIEAIQKLQEDDCSIMPLIQELSDQASSLSLPYAYAAIHAFLDFNSPDDLPRFMNNEALGTLVATILFCGHSMMADASFEEARGVPWPMLFGAFFDRMKGKFSVFLGDGQGTLKYLILTSFVVNSTDVQKEILVAECFETLAANKDKPEVQSFLASCK